MEASNAPRAPTWHCSNNVGAQGERSSGNSLLGSHTHSLQPTYRAGADHQEAAGPAEDEVLSPHLSRLAESSPRADAAEPAAPSPTATSHHCDTGHASSTAQQPADEAGHQHAVQDCKVALTAEQPASQLVGAGSAPGPAVSLEAGPSRSAAPQPADLPFSHARRGYQTGSEAPRHLTPVPRARRGGYTSGLRRSSATAAPLHAQTQDGLVNPAAPSLPGVSLPAAHGRAHPRAVLASPGRGESGSPSSSMLQGEPDADTHGPHTNDSRDGQLQQRMDPDAELAGVVDSFVGAIMQDGSDDEGNGEVVDERGMFQQCYKGHCNLSQNKEVVCAVSVPCFISCCFPDLAWGLCWMCPRPMGGSSPPASMQH